VKVKSSLFSKLISFKDRLFDKRFDEKTNKINKKGFRDDWFLRDVE
jgi:hypothetical protein